MIKTMTDKIRKHQSRKQFDSKFPLKITSRVTEFKGII